MLIAAPVRAQVLPEISLRADPLFQAGYAESAVICNSTSGGLQVQIRASRPANGVTVNTYAYTVSGYDRLRNHGVVAYLEDGETLTYRSRGAATYTGNSTSWFSLAEFSDGAGSPCFPNDKLITSDSVIRVVLLPGAGYTINPDMRQVETIVKDNNEEDCDDVGHIDRNDGILYKVTGNGSLGSYGGTCICSTAEHVDRLRLKPEQMCEDSPWPGSG